MTKARATQRSFRFLGRTLSSAEVESVARTAFDWEWTERHSSTRSSARSARWPGVDAFCAGAGGHDFVRASYDRLGGGRTLKLDHLMTARWAEAMATHSAAFGELRDTAAAEAAAGSRSVEWHILHTEPGAAAQAPHTDNPDDPHYETLLVALRPAGMRAGGTHFATEGRTVHATGRCVAFGGCVVHHGTVNSSRVPRIAIFAVLASRQDPNNA